MNFNIPHKGMGKTGGQSSRVPNLCMSFCAHSERIIKPLSRHGSKVALSPLRPWLSGNLFFLSRPVGLISAPSLQAKVSFMPGRGGAHAAAGGKLLLSGGGSIAGKYETKTDQTKLIARKVAQCIDRTEVLFCLPLIIQIVETRGKLTVYSHHR